MNDFQEKTLETIKTQMEQIGLCNMIQNVSEIFESKSYKTLLLRKLLLIITCDSMLENKNDEELLNIADNYGFCVPENFLNSPEKCIFINLENGSLQNEVKFWNRILKYISYLRRDPTIENVPSSTHLALKNDSTYEFEEVVKILGNTSEESSLGCVELDIDKHDAEDDLESLKKSELEIEDLIKDAHEALNYLTPLSTHSQRFVDNMQDLLNHIHSHCTNGGNGPSIINDPELFKRIELLHHQVKTFDEVLVLFNNNIPVGEAKHLMKDFSTSFDQDFEREQKRILQHFVSVCRNALEMYHLDSLVKL